MAKINKEKSKEKVNEKARYKEAINFLRAVKKNARLTDKDRMIFTCSISEQAFDILSAFLKEEDKLENNR